MNNKEKAYLGKFGEELAANFLLSNGYEILKKNYHSRFGEIDIITLLADTVIFVEVKLRSSNLDQAVSSVSVAKQKKLVKTAQDYLARHPELEDLPTRFDIIAIIKNKRSYELKHFPDAFLPREYW
ncbi:MAG: YraN family protein [Candidatus Cloacimonetes bacterium]|nr:YraN family protein [Candidatus Cloacimonadota bacterium]MCF7814381.1 YraN family protein [Candidatus Cloacimonadota bacterium]MCF7869004.1 YraN family protein [Candidatus Cloacimonadota bacterium]MCF7884398.1 YraN family protein [Candidatus Cloacimonadota bacterium]